MDDFMTDFIDSFLTFIKESNSLNLKSISSNESWNNSLLWSINWINLFVKADVTWAILGFSEVDNFFWNLFEKIVIFSYNQDSIVYNF